MSSIGDLSISISADASQVTAGMTETRNQLQQTNTVIVQQQGSWLSFSSAVLSVIGAVIGPIFKMVTAYKQMQMATMGMTLANTLAIPPTLTLAGAMAFLLSPITLIIAGLALLAAAFYFFSSSTSDAGDATEDFGDRAKKLSTDAEATAGVMSGLGQSMSSAFSEGMNTADAEVSLKKMNTEAGNVQTAFATLYTETVGRLIDLANVIAMAAGSLVPLETMANIAAAGLKFLADTVNYVAGGFRMATTILAAVGIALGSGTAPSYAAGAAYVQLGENTTAATKKSIEFTQHLEYAKTVHTSLALAIAAAADATQRASEIADIGKMFDPDQIAKATDELKLQDAAQIQALATQRDMASAALSAQKAAIGKSDNPAAAKEKFLADEKAANALIAANEKAFIDDSKARHEALAKQSKGVSEGTIVDPTILASAKQYEDSQNAIKKILGGVDESIIKLTTSEDEQMRATMRANGADNEQIALLDKKLQAQKLATDAKDAAKRAEDQLRASEKKGVTDSIAANETLAKKRQELDLLTGAITPASVALKELTDQGFSGEQLDEMVKMTDEVNKIKADKSKSSTEPTGGPAALLKGSAGALSAIFSAGRNPLGERQAKAAEQTVAEAQRISAAIEKQTQEMSNMMGGGNDAIGKAIS